jgi:hypothetical protein
MAAKTRLGATGSSVNDMGNMGALTPILGQLAGGTKRGQMAIDFAQQLYPEVEKPDPYEAALQYFLEMGRQASQPGATVLGSAVGAMQAPADYLSAKKKEKKETDRARMQTALSLAPSLKPKPVAGSTKAVKVVDKDGNVKFMSESEAIRTQATPYIADKTTTTFKERKFFKTGFDPVVVKNEADALQFENQGWATVPPEDWTDSKGGTDEDAAEVQASKILDSGVIVYAFKDGTRKVVDGLGNEVTGEDAAKAIEEAEERGIELQRERAGGRRAGTVGVDTALAAFERVGEIRTNIANLEEAKRLLLPEDQGGGGANSGQLADLLPNWKASTIALENVKNRLGLDVVGSVTFGALSESELNMALNTALPTNMPEDQLIQWLDDKIKAQNKLMAYLNDQAIFLSDGDKTVGDWLRHVREKQEELKRIEAERKQAGTNFDFSTMDEEALQDVDLSSLDDDQLDAFLKRMAELGL